jgi:hypothetical protein
MSHWNHRVIKSSHLEAGEMIDYYAIHEVFYNDDGTIYSYTQNPVDVGGDNINELRETLERMLRCLDNPILEQPIECIGD